MFVLLIESLLFAVLIESLMFVLLIESLMFVLLIESLLFVLLIESWLLLIESLRFVLLIESLMFVDINMIINVLESLVVNYINIWNRTGTFTLVSVPFYHIIYQRDFNIFLNIFIPQD